MSVRVRYAPSPTGEPHVGNIRTALFNWLFARHEGGSFVLRIEDTDRARLAPGALDAIFDSLRWLGLDWDEGPEVGGPHAPYVQSERLHHYQRAARQLIEAGHAYHCYCSPQRLDEMRKEQQRRRLPPKYDRRCRDLSAGERREFEALDIVPVLRFKTPLSGQTAFHDLVRNDVVFDNDTLDDFVLLKSDGYPTYHLANVVDDHLMAITHILRGDEWLSSTPRHVLLYAAFGWQPPLFVHLPMILGPDKAKLSKRHGDTSVLAFHDRGFLPEALFNFLALLGWSLDDRTEIIDRQTFVRHFSLDRILKNPAVFNREKLEWLNGIYIRQLAIDDLADRVAPFLERAAGRPVEHEYLLRIVPLIRERIKSLSDAKDMAVFFVEDWIGREFREKPEEAARVLEDVYKELATPGRWESKSIEQRVRKVAERSGFDRRTLFRLIREAVTDRTATPPLFESMAVLGQLKTLRRLESAIEWLSNLTIVPPPGETESQATNLTIIWRSSKPR